ncbi:MAG: NUDIX domain-containing protein [Patescibacteria group bacterium]|nr:NUDIX domain-containing protein [Patescibacteria group bacterium]
MDLGAKALVIYDKKLLLVLRDNDPAIPYPNTWNLPGGGVEDGEGPDEALMRELMEEISVVPKRIERIGFEQYSDGKAVVRYLVRLDKDEKERLKLGDEGQEMRFFSIDETVALPFSHYIGNFIRRNAEYLKEIIEENAEIVPQKLGLEP